VKWIVLAYDEGQFAKRSKYMGFYKCCK
jgi:hypothetical protein